MNFKQFLVGFGNHQNIEVIQSRQIVSFLPSDLEEILDALIDGAKVPRKSASFVPPNLTIKNPLNGINSSQFKLIEQDYIQFGVIDEILREDANRDVQGKYMQAARLLNAQYLTGFEGNIPEFIIQAIGAHRRDAPKNATSAHLVKTHILLNYMYCNCDIGIQPNDNQ